MREKLEKLSGPTFDVTYILAQIVDHQKTVQLLQWEIGQGQDAHGAVDSGRHRALGPRQVTRIDRHDRHARHEPQTAVRRTSRKPAAFGSWGPVEPGGG